MLVMAAALVLLLLAFMPVPHVTSPWSTPWVVAIMIAAALAALAVVDQVAMSLHRGL